MKKILYIFILPLTFLLVSCEPDPDCHWGEFSIHHPTALRGIQLTEDFVNSSFWTLTNGTEVSSNGYYLNYPDGIVTTSTNTTNYVPGDEGWYDGLTINFKLGDNIIEDGCINCETCTAVVVFDQRTFHSFEGELERIYNYDGIYDTVTENYVNVDAQTNYRNTQPTFLITAGNGYTREVQFLEGWRATPLKLRSTSMDTFTNYWDPLNDTVYWSSYINTKTYTRPAGDESW